MIDKGILIKRLSLIKYLYNQAVEQSKKAESLAAFSVLGFHDSIEMFLKLVAEHIGVKLDRQIVFIEHWNKIPSLTHVESMRKLNDVRVSFKHKGIIPAKEEVEACRVYTRDFFQVNALSQMDIDFGHISMIDLLSYNQVKSTLKKAVDKLEKNDFAKSAEYSAIAFQELLDTFDATKKDYFTSLLPIDHKTDLLDGVNTFDRHSLSGTREQEAIGRELKQFASNIHDEIDAVRGQFKIISYGIDYLKYAKFVLIAPEIVRTYPDGFLSMDRQHTTRDRDQCQFCIDFVIESATIMQAIDHDLSTIYTAYKKYS